MANYRGRGSNKKKSHFYSEQYTLKSQRAKIITQYTSKVGVVLGDISYFHMKTWKVAPFGVLANLLLELFSTFQPQSCETSINAAMTSYRREWKKGRKMKKDKKKPSSNYVHMDWLHSYM